MRVETLADGVTLYCGDCLDALDAMEENSIDSVVCDPPYHLTSIVKRFGKEGSAPAQFGTDGRFKRLSGGFMSKTWDAPEPPAIDPEFAHWLAGFVDGEGCFSVHKKNVNGFETYDCQFHLTLRDDDKDVIVEIQRQLGGIGTIAARPAPKVGNGKPQVRYCVSSKRDCLRLREVFSIFPLRAKKARDFEIWSQALDAWVSHEPGSSWDDVAYYRDALMAVRQYGAAFHPSQLFHYRWARKALRVLKPGGHLVSFAGTRTYHRMASAVEDAGFEVRDCIMWVTGQGFPKSHNLEGEWEGWGTALKPALEPCILARKPLSEPTVAANVLKWGTGALNIDATRVACEPRPHRERRNDKSLDGDVYGSGINGSRAIGVTTNARWPANLAHDGSEEVVAGFPETGKSKAAPRGGSNPNPMDWGNGRYDGHIVKGHDDNGGSAARFFYTAKADFFDRAFSKHPTVKPVALMRWLVRMVTPPGGTVLDPFAGTGTTGQAAMEEGFRAVLIEREEEYQADIRRRISLVFAGEIERGKHVAQDSHETLPLFSESAE